MLGANVIAMSGRAVEAAGDVDVLLLDKTGTITLGNRQASAFVPAPGVTHAISPTPRSSPRSPTRRPRGAASSCSRRQRSASASATSSSWARSFVPFSATDPHERRQLRRTRRSARAPPMRSASTSQERGGAYPAEVDARGRGRRAPRQHAARRRRGRPRARRDRAEGHRQGRHQGALRRAAPHGHQDRDDHRRQPAHRGRDRRRGRRRRLPRRGDAGSEARADPRATRPKAAWSR